MKNYLTKIMEFNFKSQFYDKSENLGLMKIDL